MLRKWVLSVPKRLRPYLHHNPDVASSVLHIFLRAIRSTLRATSPGAPALVRDTRIGAVSFLHRFGSSLNAHFHYHVLVLDGVFAEAEDGDVRIHEAFALERLHALRTFLPDFSRRPSALPAPEAYPRRPDGPPPQLIPPPRIHRHHYHGVLPLLCPSCGGQMRVVSFLTEPATIQPILVHLDLARRPPPVAPARDPPQGDFLLDQSPAFDPTEPEPVPAPTSTSRCPTSSMTDHLR